MNIFDALILGLVEGITEFLPISSTGHLIVTGELLGLVHDDFLKTFEIVIQLGAILAVVVLYWRSFLNLGALKKVAVAFIPTGIIGFILYKLIKDYLLGNVSVVLWSLVAGGLILIAFEYYYGKRMDQKQKGAQGPEMLPQDIKYTHAFVVGLFQSIAVIPGVSRSAATILGGLSLGIPRKTIIEFSFLLAVPTMLAASGYDLLKNAGSFSFDQFDVLIVGFFAAFVVALVSIVFLLRFIQKHDFSWFGLYRIVAAIAFWFILF